MTKLCVECKHFIPYRLKTHPELSYCGLAKDVDVVTGEVTYTFCSVERAGNLIGCTQAGKNWEPKGEVSKNKSFWSRFWEGV